MQTIGKHENIIGYNRYGKKIIKEEGNSKCAYLALEYIENKPSLLEYVLSK